jgi:hypothetical protein
MVGDIAGGEDVRILSLASGCWFRGPAESVRQSAELQEHQDHAERALATRRHHCTTPATRLCNCWLV